MPLSVIDNTGVGGVINSGTSQASTSGTSVTFTGIPSWVKRVTVMFGGVSVSGTSSLRIQIGSGSVTSSGYTGGTATIASASASSTTTGSAGFDLNSQSAVQTLTAVGSVVLLNISGNQWIASGWISYDTAGQTESINGRVTLSGALDRVVVTTVNGTDTFDAGSINILYE